jgi:hypothetical protein
MTFHLRCHNHLSVISCVTVPYNASAIRELSEKPLGAFWPTGTANHRVLLAVRDGPCRTKMTEWVTLRKRSERFKWPQAPEPSIRLKRFGTPRSLRKVIQSNFWYYMEEVIWHCGGTKQILRQPIVILLLFTKLRAHSPEMPILHQPETSQHEPVSRTGHSDADSRGSVGS